ncbi:hypothetical protein [Campylobacter sp. MG1]|uniref:hypothetical protein n=1 Tax=Campylobacter sp. MG1 TaxID=2976332 RepID=UPI00226D1BE8|nr:hypothetical protein [Campylobacter sp. MG1]
MNSKLIIILSIMIIVISSFGIINQKQNTSNDNKVKKEIHSVLVLSKDIKKGEILKNGDIKVENKELNIDYLKDSLIIDKNIDFIINGGFSLNKDLNAKSILRYEDLLKGGILDDSLDISVDGELAFIFNLNEREINILKDIKKGENVDVYFKYEEKTKSQDSGIVTRSDNLNKANKENANLINLVLFFKDKRILNKNNSNGENQVILQMSANDVKTIYAIENLGHFYIFPADKNSKESFSAEKILVKEHVKELRGDGK